MKLKLMIAGLTALLLAACTEPATDVDFAEREVTQSAIGTIRDIDPEARRFVLRIDGRTLTLRANEGIRNFDQLMVGDRIRVAYREALAVTMADPDDSGEMTADVFQTRTPEGALPGAVEAGMVTLVVELLGYDADTNTAVLRGPEGEEFAVEVAPEMRDFARSRSVGDRILVAYTIAAAVSVEPAAET